MLYNKPRDIKLRALPTVGSVIKRADSVKNKFTKEAKKDDTDKLILLNEAVPHDNEVTAGVVVSEKKIAPSTVINKTVEGVEDSDFDIILTEPPANPDADDIIIDLTEMPVIEGIPMLTLPDEPQKAPEVKHKKIVYVDTPKIEKAPEISEPITPENDVFDLSEMPDIDGIPMLELKPVTEEKIQLLEDFVYAPEKKAEHKPVHIPRPDIDIDEPAYTPTAEDVTTEPVIEDAFEVEEIAEEALPEEAVLEDTTEELIPEIEVEPITEEIAEEAVILEAPETDEMSVVSEASECEMLTEVQESTEASAPPPFVQATAKRGRKAKKKEKQQKKKEKEPKQEKLDLQKPAEVEKSDSIAPAPKKKEKKTKKPKPVITNKRRYLKKKGVQIKLRLKAAQDNRKEKRKAKGSFGKARALKVASFFLLLYVGTVLAFTISIRPTYSETEKRPLAKFPEYSMQALLSGDFFADIDTWFSDTFPFRETLTQTDTFIKSLYGIDTISIHGDVDRGDDIPDAPGDEPVKKPEAPEVTKPVEMPDDEELSKDNGNPNAVRPDYDVQSLSAIVVAGDSAYEYYSFSKEVAPRFIDCVNTLDSITNPLGNVYAMIVPTSMDIKLNDAIRAEVDSANQKKALDYFNASFKNTIAVDGIYDAEREHRNEYTYFRADHHWTALGAYYAYEQFAIEKGIEPVPLTKYKTQKFDNFIGTFYSSSGQNPALKKNPDYVMAYLPFNKVTCKISDSVLYEGFDYDVIKDVSEDSPGSKYLTFIGGDNGLTTITNLDLPRGESCLVIKDSFGNAMVPFLIPHYNKIYVIDPRHYKGTLSDFCEEKTVNDVIVLTNISTTRNYVYLEALENFVQ